MRDDAGLFNFVRLSTPKNAQFLVPPDLEHFRLEGERAIVVDFKGLPMNKAGQIEWYQRLEHISGTIHPKNMDVVRHGYLTLDARRLEKVRCEYGVTYVVLRAGQPLSAPGWNDVFRNNSFRVMSYREHYTCPPQMPQSPN